MTYQDILLDLYGRYYTDSCSGSISQVVSDFWKDYSSKHKVELKNGRWIVKGYGMGGFFPSTIINRCLHIPKDIRLFYFRKHFPEQTPLLRYGKLVARLSERVFNFDCLRLMMSFGEIVKRLNIDRTDKGQYDLVGKGIKTVCVIGDGYAYGGALAKIADPRIRIVFVNIGRTLFFDAYYSQKCFPNEAPVLLRRGSGNRLESFDRHKIVFLEAEDYDMLAGLPIDLFININSMQEIEQPIVGNYFRYMRESASDEVYFYCCNRLEKKMLKGEVISRFMKYPWLDSKVLLDEPCPWFQTEVVSHPTLRFLTPVWKKLDGSFQHRLVRLK